jgi:Tol biopolymer transport system component
MSSLAVPVNGTFDVALPAGAYVVRLEGVAPNCVVGARGLWGAAVPIDLPRTSTAPAKAPFDVQCEAIPDQRLTDGAQLAFVRDGQIWLVGSDGSNPVPLTSGPGDHDPAWSPDGRRIAFTRQDAIYIMEADGSNVVRLTHEPYSSAPTWSPDGRRLAYATVCSSGDGCVLIASTDPADTTRVRVGWPRGRHGTPAWSPDGTRIAFVSDAAAFDFVSDLYIETLADGTIAQVTSGFRFSDEGPIPLYEHPAWSPDGGQLALIDCPVSYFTCDSSDLLVTSADGSGLRPLGPPRAGRPTWSPDGRTIAFSVGALSSGNPGSIQWIRADGSERGIIVDNGSEPAWRPTPSAGATASRARP